jgi:lysophospholipase L1-like esterase
MRLKKLGCTLVVGTVSSVTLSIVASAGTYPTRLANAGDSISQGWDADDIPHSQVKYSWVQGTSSVIDSIYSRYKALAPKITQDPESVFGAEMVGGGDNFAAQASRICASKTPPQHVTVLFGANDVCNAAQSDGPDPTVNMYAPSTFTGAFDAGMEELESCLPTGATIEVISMPRVDQVYVAGMAKSSWCPEIWRIATVCTLVTSEPDPARRALIGAAVDTYNQALADDVAAWNSNSNGKNTAGLKVVTDWKGSIASGFTDTSLGSHLFNASEINTVDCFHPNEAGQAELACNGWVNDPDGSGVESACFTQEGN